MSKPEWPSCFDVFHCCAMLAEVIEAWVNLIISILTCPIYEWMNISSLGIQFVGIQRKRIKYNAI